MNFFDGRFDFLDVSDLGGDRYKVKGRFVDSTGMYSINDAKVGDIIYGTSAVTSKPLLRYKIVELHAAEFVGSVMVATIEWDMVPGIVPTAPYSGMEGIIGALQSNGLTANITSSSINSANILLINKAESYQAMLLGTLSGTPDFTDLTRRVSTLEDQVLSVRMEWE